MDDRKSINEIRQALFDDVWSGPMTAVAEKYQVSDNGLRKRCKSLNIPLPPFGYWAKKKAGKLVAERPLLPPFNETALVIDDYEDERGAFAQTKRTGKLEYRELDSLSLNEVCAMRDLDVLTPESQCFVQEWCVHQKVPGRVHDFHDLISRHRIEVEYREERDKAYPFKDTGIQLWQQHGQIEWRRNNSVLPISVSRGQRDRAYRIVNTIFNALSQLKGKPTVTNRYTRNNEAEDNVDISLMGSVASFEMKEHAEKRRHIESASPRAFRPIYEHIPTGRMSIEWVISPCYYYDRSESPPHHVYKDFPESPLENQVSEMLFWLIEHCCHNHKTHFVDEKIREQQREKAEQERIVREQEQKRRRLHEEQQQRRASLMSHIGDHATNWFERERLMRFVECLRAFRLTCEDGTTADCLDAYIMLVEQKATAANPLDLIVSEMKDLLAHEGE